MKKDTAKITNEAIIHLIIERFDDLENETGQDFTYPKRIILRLAKKIGLFDYPPRDNINK